MVCDFAVKGGMNSVLSGVSTVSQGQPSGGQPWALLKQSHKVERMLSPEAGGRGVNRAGS